VHPAATRIFTSATGRPLSYHDLRVIEAILEVFLMLRPHTLFTLILAILLFPAVHAENDGGRSGKRIVDYHSARPLMWGTLYTHGGETLYCGQRFGARKGNGINIEHVFPMSWAAWHFKCGKRKACRRSSDVFNRVEADLHNLWPTLVKANKARSSHPFGIIEGESYLIKGCDFEVDERRRIVEPRAQARGQIARSMFYMANEYGLEIRSRHGKMLKRWHRDHPVSPEEKRRNKVIEHIQGNRNPYIDHPQLADQLHY
jgi:deoxyribonuclease-1